MDLYEEHIVGSRNEVIRLANKIIEEIRKTGKKYTIVWGDVDSIEFMKQWKKKKNQPKMTDKELRKGIVNVLRDKFKLGGKL